MRERGLDLSEVRGRVNRSPGTAMWRSLDELAGSDKFRQALEREFPDSIWDYNHGGFSRRNFLRLMGASMALAGLYGCSERPSGKILPYIQQPEQIVPGMPLYFATAMPLNGYGLGVLAESHEGRPTKIEGNPDHPASRGGTNIFMQASVLQLYDPERAKNVQRAGIVSSWEAFREELTDRLNAKRSSGGQGVRILTGTVTSPTLAWQIAQFLKEFPSAQWHHYDPLARQNSQKGAMQAFGQLVSTVYRFRRVDQQHPENNVEAKVVVSLDHDFLWADPGSVAYARQFAEGRKVRVRHWNQTTMSRLYVVESTFTLTGSMADHRIPTRPDEVEAFARALASRLGVQGAASAQVPARWAKYLDAMVSDLQANKGASLVLIGESLPPELHALGHAINAALGNVDKTVYYTKPVEVFPLDQNQKPVTGIDSLRQLVDDMNHGRVDTLLIFGGNPAYDAPADLHFADALYRLTHPQQPGSSNYLNFTARLGLYDDETSYICQWSLPESHYLESWADVRAYDGTASIIQPLISSLTQGRSAIEIMDVALTPPSQFRFRGGYEIVREYWQTQVKPEDFDGKWNNWLKRGVIEGFALEEQKVTAGGAGRAQAEETGQGKSAPQTQPTSGGQLDVVFRSDPSIWDGTFTNHGWLQECPKFLTKLVWDNAALMSPKTAETLGQNLGTLADGEVLQFKSPDGLAVKAPVMLLPGLPDNVITMHMGYGRTRGGSSAREANDVPRGFSAYALRQAGSPWVARGVSVERTGDFHQLVVTHNHFAMDTLSGFGSKYERGQLKPHAIVDPSIPQDERELYNRRLIRTTTLAYFNEDPDHRHFVKELGTEEEERATNGLQIYPHWDYSNGYQWGMSIDVQSCIGCNACLVGCVAENNIAVVGREEVARQREMHWIRIDDYFGDSRTPEQIKAGDDPLANPRVYHQPIPCMQCENAPCELVCPVGATVHSPEGLNDMVYNRCVGTRYCSNNCPYKVRRFNFFNWMKGGEPEFELQHNPQVTVRSRGVMEKCTYCIQRITYTRIQIEQMIVAMDERADKLRQEQHTADPQRRQQIDAEIAEIKRKRHNGEFETLERLQTACQQACPTGAISFGHILPVTVINEEGQEEQRLTMVKKLKQEPTDYPLLAELTTRPRTTYMARLRNPNPDLEPDAKS